MKEDIDSSVLGLLDRLKKEKERELLKEVNIIQVCMCAFVGQQTRSLEGWHCWIMVHLASSHVLSILLQMTVILNILGKSNFFSHH